MEKFVCLICREEEALDSLINYHFDPLNKIKHLVHADCLVAKIDLNCPLCGEPEFSVIKGSCTEVDKQELQAYYDNIVGIFIDSENISDQFISFVERIIENGLEIKFTLNGCAKELVDKFVKITCCNGNIPILKLVLDSGFDIHIDNGNALNISAENGHLDVVKYLVEHGADTCAEYDHALCLSIENEYFDIVKYLVELGANIFAEDNFAIRKSAIIGDLEVVKY